MLCSLSIEGINDAEAYINQDLSQFLNLLGIHVFAGLLVGASSHGFEFVAVVANQLFMLDHLFLVELLSEGLLVTIAGMLSFD